MPLRKLFFIPLFIAYSVMVAHEVIPHHHHLTPEQATEHHDSEHRHSPVTGNFPSHSTHFVHMTPSDYFRYERQAIQWLVTGLENWITVMVSTGTEGLISSGNCKGISHPPEHFFFDLASHFLPVWTFRGPPACGK